MSPTTAKGEETRKHILETALGLFQSKGYEATTMRDIAAAAECSLGLTYRYFERKEDLVMALYQRLAGQFEAHIIALEPLPMAKEFERAMRYKLALLEPYREALGAMFSAMMNPNSEIAVLGKNSAVIRTHVHDLYRAAITRATDAPNPKQIEQLADVLYGAHLALVLLWLYDRTPDRRATHESISLMRDGLGLVRPLLVLPPVSALLTRLSGIAHSIIGGDDDGTATGLRENLP